MSYDTLSKSLVCMALVIVCVVVFVISVLFSSSFSFSKQPGIWAMYDTLVKFRVGGSDEQFKRNHIHMYDTDIHFIWKFIGKN